MGVQGGGNFCIFFIIRDRTFKHDYNISISIKDIKKSIFCQGHTRLGGGAKFKFALLLEIGLVNININIFQSIKEV
jgi:hypothetical protein